MRVLQHIQLRHLVLTADLTSVALFAAEGATAGINVHLDFLGVLVLAFITAVGGGMIRDLLLGSLPPAAIRDWRYPAIAFLSGFMVFFLHTHVASLKAPLVLTLDAAGLSLCAIAGASKAIDFHLHPLPAIMIGGISGVGGGTLRDILINRIPGVLSSEIYATAALLGAAVVVFLLKLRLRPEVANFAGFTACFTLRILAVRHHWNLPVA